jgi:hypothetical protein
MTDFPPSRRGMALQVTLILVLASLTAVFGLLASQESINLRFIVYILIATVAFFPLPFMSYRLYSLNRSNYTLDRDKLTLTWGLRVEQIPVSEVEWVRKMESMKVPLSLPFLHLPGAITGLKRHAELGPVEFLASDSKTLVVVATAKRVFVISPADTTGFMQNIQRTIEMGSLSPAASQSVYPTFVIAQAWESMLARYLWLAGLFLNVGMLVWVSLMIPTLGHVSLGFQASGTAREAVLGAGLILLPLVSIFFYLLGWVAGLIIYRRPDHRLLAQLIWASGVVSAILFLLAVMFVITTPA